MPNRQPFDPDNSVLPISGKFTFPAIQLVNAAASTFYQGTGATPVPHIPAVETVGVPKVYPNNLFAPALDTTTNEAGVLLMKGVYRFDLSVRCGDGGANAAGSFQFALITKNTADATGLIMLTPLILTSAVAGSTTGSLDATNGVHNESAFFEISSDLTTVQLVSRKNTATANACSLKHATLVVTRVANFFEGTN